MSFARIVKEAFDGSDQRAAPALGPKISVFGCGGGGCNSIHRLRRLGLSGVETIAINTDKYHLSGVDADRQILVGEHITKGFGTGGDPYIGEKCARDSFDEMVKAMRDVDLAFITAGLGGGSGTGIAPVVAEAAKKCKVLTVAIVTTPFAYERGRYEIAEEGIRNLNDTTHCTVVLDNNKLLNLAPKLPLDRAFTVMDQLIAETVKGLSETLFETSMINLDFSDFRNIMADGGIGTMMISESEDVDELIGEALSNPFLDVDFTDARGALIHITGGPSLSLREAYAIFQGIVNELPAARNIKFGAKIDAQERGKAKRVMGIVTGVKKNESALNEAQQEVHGNTRSGAYA